MDRQIHYGRLPVIAMDKFPEIEAILIAVADEDPEQCCVAACGRKGPIGPQAARLLLEMMDKLGAVLRESIARSEDKVGQA